MGYSEDAFAEWLKATRTHRKMSQAELAKALSARGIAAHATTIAKIEAGDRAVRLDEAVELCIILGGALGDLFPPGESRSLSRKVDALEVQLGSVLRQLDAAATTLYRAYETLEIGATLYIGAANTEEEARERVVWDVAELVTQEIQDELHVLIERLRHGLTAFALSDAELSEFYTRSEQRRERLIDLDHERLGLDGSDA
ncbi:Uncharacterised protein [Mycobacteroides abscessus subsp. abscessus]|nr:Uncharacterised protein [Mycobacteroides abscessus subsp. abscessus]